jgi:hypothetical protein
MKMTNILILVLVLVWIHVRAEPADLQITNSPAHLELRDQFGAIQKLDFPKTNITFLVIADWKGSREVAGWIAPIKHRFDTRIDIRGLADVSCVPGPLHGLVERRFRAAESYPVMMDWTGEAARSFAYVPGMANVLVLNRRGGILFRTGGAAADKPLQDLYEVLTQALSLKPPHTCSK